MRIEKREQNDEKRVLTAMIVSTIVLGRVAVKWEDRMFRTRWANLIGSWCVHFYREYEKAPMQHIEDIFQDWATDDQDPKLVTLVDRFLAGLSDDFESEKEEVNSEYLCELADRHFTQVRLRKVRDELERVLERGDVKQGNEILEGYHRLNLATADGWIDPFHNAEELKAAFASGQDSLIHYPGDLGRFFGNSLTREAFISFMGPEKRGKSFWLLDVVWRGIFERRRVAFFEAGDMGRDETMRRISCRATRRPLDPGTIEVPMKIKFDEDDEEEDEGNEGEAKARTKGNGLKVSTSTKERDYEGELNWQVAWKGLQRISRRKIKSQGSYLRLCCRPTGTLSVTDMETTIQDWERDGWMPDIVVVDYADILAPPPGLRDEREQINKTWMQLRQLAQKYHCLVVTATQSDAASYSARVVRRKHFTNDKRKLAHITGMIGLNATDQEKDALLMRLNWIARRNAAYNESRVVYVAGSLELANPAMISSYPPRR